MEKNKSHVKNKYTKLPPANFNRKKAINKSINRVTAEKKKGLFHNVFKKFRADKGATEIIRYREGVDRIFLILIIILLSFGTVMVFSASYAYALSKYGDSYFFAKKQLIMVALGLIVMIITSYAADYGLLKKIAVPFFIGVLILNYLTRIFGIITNGAPRWFRVFGFQFQPSELLKTAIVLLFGFYIVRMGDKMRTFKYGILIPFAIIALVGGAMVTQSHFSGLIIMFMLIVFMIFIGEAPIKYLAILGVTGASIIYVFITFTTYASSRIDSWLHPFEHTQGKGYQTIQSLLAIGSGGLLGVGLGQSKQKFLYLPEPQNDFIFSIVCEELGFIGALVVILLFVILVWRGFVIAYHAPDKFSALVVIGIMVKVSIQLILNIAVVTNTIPNTGISLPFFSYGGTALIVLLFEMGIILSISRYSYHEKGQ